MQATEDLKSFMALPGFWQVLCVVYQYKNVAIA